MPPLILVLAALSLAAPALAHDDATLDVRPAPNGGQVRMAGPYHFELVLGDNGVAVFITDHADAPVASKGVSGNVILMGGERATIALAPTGDNRLAGIGAITPSADIKAVVSLTFPDGNTWQARFTPDAPAKAEAAEAETEGHAHSH